MEIKNKWTDNDFKTMGWHDSRLYQLKFPDEECDFVLYLDYIFKWVKQEEGYKFWVSPCKLIFKNVTSLDIKISFNEAIGIDIENIERERLGLTPNRKMTDWKYQIKTDKGYIDFVSTGFEMNLISQPILSNNQSINS